MNLPATIQPRGMVSQLEKDLFHLESGGESFDQNGGSDSIMRHADVRLGEKENVVPQAGLEVVLHLWKVKVRAKAPLNEFLGIVIKVKAKIEQGTRHWHLVDGDAWFIEVPATRSHNEDSRVWREFILLSV